jgi:hypothetical protein
MVQLQFIDNKPVFPKIDYTCDDPFLSKIQKAGKKWIILTDENNNPKLALDADGFLRSALFQEEKFNPLDFCHRPIIVSDPKSLLGDAIVRLRVRPEKSDDDVIDKDIILFWGDEKKIITGSDVLGRLLKGIVQHEEDTYLKIYE